MENISQINQAIVDIIKQAKYNDDGTCINIESYAKLPNAKWLHSPKPLWNFADFYYRVIPEIKQYPLTQENLLERELCNLPMRVKVNTTLSTGTTISYPIISKYDDMFVWIDGIGCTYEELMTLCFIDDTPCYKKDKRW